MSNALAIGAVTAVLKHMLDNRMSDPIVSGSLGGNVSVTALSPDLVLPDNPETQDDILNLYFYQAIFNPGWRNVGLPSRNAAGDQLTNPPLALDLRYLLTAYSREPFHAEMLLGYGMQLFHEVPVLTRDAIRAAWNPPPAGAGSLATSGLAEQIEQIKICPQVMDTEEMSKLWSAFQSHYRPTAAYQVSVVLIESDRSTRSALPVRDRRLLVVPFSRPTIESVNPQVIQPNGTLTIEGINLSSAIVQIKFGNDTVLVPDLVDVTSTQIQVTLPATLSAGVNALQVLHLLDFGTGDPSEPHRGFESNVVAFILAPEITTVFPPPPNLLSVARGANLDLSVNPSVSFDQRVELLVGDRSIAIPARDPATLPVSSLNFPIPSDFPTGVFLLRLRVDGAESLLQVDEDETSPTFNQYIDPQIAIT